MSSQSLAMGPSKQGYLRFSLHAQFCVKPIRSAPPGTDLAGQTALITGAGSGLGFHAADHLLSLNLSRLIMAVRSVEAGKSAAAKLQAKYPSAHIDVWPLEMTSYASIQALAARVDTELPRLDIAILNAGVTALRHELVPSTGHEKVIQVNYLSTYLLAILLLPSLKSKSASPRPGRLTIVGSGMAYYASLPNRHKVPLLASFDDTHIQKWNPTERYAASKLLLHMFLVKLATHIDPDDVVVNICDPGLCKGSRLQRDADGTLFGWVFGVVKALSGRTPEDGAWTYVDAAVCKGRESHGCFLTDWRVAPFARLVYEPEMAAVIDRLWDETIAEFEFAGVREILGLKKA
ncbi:putative short-chain dehydrogenase/reductase family protein [Coniochaeta ligniaria NRRL 30616]|uniref:Putative short-chain dehydrogenase/reductase family protein n=1 Tax=Coniochaeta ligniaria NRRL 30616 TaxID=1408157 RepID=A0A1J7IJW0_9PEZI|nr:putative short-chain dehydrogenase/reductase family protein [Coniochaeta ligniaria NRRL 30616]